MKKNYIVLTLLCLFAVNGIYAQNSEPPSDLFDAEVEVESEVEAEAQVGQAAGSVAVSAAAAANFLNAIAHIKISAGISKAAMAPANQAAKGSLSSKNMDNKILNDDIDFAVDKSVGTSRVNFDLANAESEVESEVEVEVENGAAVAVGATSVGASGVGASLYTTKKSSDPVLYPSNSITAVSAKTSTDVNLSEVTIPFPNESSNTVSGEIPANMDTETSTSAKFESLDADLKSLKMPKDDEESTLPFGVLYASFKDKPVSQVDTDTETEVESEAEAEVETETGGAGAAASAGSASVVAGDFAIADSDTQVDTSTSTSVVDEAEPSIFTIPEPEINSAENIESGNENTTTTTSKGSKSSISTEKGQPKDKDAAALADVPSAINGKGFNDFEIEAESEVEAETEVDNGSAGAAVAATGGAGGNGQVSSAEAISSIAVSTSTKNNNGVGVGANDESFEQKRRHGALDTALPGSSAEAEAEASADSSAPSTNESAEAIAIGDALAFGSLAFGDIQSNVRRPKSAKSELVSDLGDDKGYDFFTTAVRAWDDVLIASTSESGQVELRGIESSEIEAEVESEAEAEVGFNAAAAAAGTNAVQAKNGVLNFQAQAATSASTATKVFDQPENVINDSNTTTPETDLSYPDYGIDFENYAFETEAEAETEAEVGFNSAAVAVSAAGAGYEGIQVKTAHETTLFSAAGAAGAGQVVTVSISMPTEGQAGKVTASAMATDDMNRGVAVAVAVAGVPNTPGEDNEMEAENEGFGFASASVSIFTNPADAENPVILNGFTASTTSAEPKSNETSVAAAGQLGEVEVEAESEAEAGYGVAAAAATSGASGRGAKSLSFTSVSTANYTAGYTFDFNALINESISLVEGTESDVALAWNGYGYQQFSIQKLDKETGEFMELGLVDRSNPDIWEAYKFAITGLPAEEDQTFRIVPVSEPEAFVELMIMLAPTSSTAKAAQEKPTIVIDDGDDIQMAPYPNPTPDKISMVLGSEQIKDVSARLYSITGEQITKFNKLPLTGTEMNQVSWPIDGSIPNGLYILKVNSNSLNKSFKILIER